MTCWCGEKGFRHWWRYLKFRLYYRRVRSILYWRLRYGYVSGPSMMKDEYLHWFISKEERVMRRLLGKTN